MAKKESHINVKDLGNGFVQLTPAKGYKLYSLRLRRSVSEAVVKAGNSKDFAIVKDNE